MPPSSAPTGRLMPRASGTVVARLVRSGRFEAPVAFAAGTALLACSILATVSAAFGLWQDGDAGLRLVGLAVVWFALGGGLVRQCRAPHRLRATTAFVGAFVVWVELIAVSTVTYWVLGVFPHFDDALFESVAGFATTATSVVADPEHLSAPVLAWRAGTQWLGGLGGLLFVVAVLPSIGVGGLDVTAAGRRYSGASLQSRRTVDLVRHLAQLYCLLTAAGVVLFLTAGLEPFDALTYAATTISTGGFANHAGSFGHFDSTLAEWAGVGGMLLGGANLALVWRAVSGTDRRSLWRSFELRAYLTVFALTTAALVVLTSDGIDHQSVRQTAFHVASAISTTGHFVGDGWRGWDSGAQVVLLAVMGVGAMSGSAGSGFRMVRALALFGYLRREFVLQIHPRAVGSVRVGRRPLEEELVERMVGYQIQYLVIAATGAVVIGALGVDLVTAVSAAISGLANVGPAMGDFAPLEGGVAGMARPARVALMPLMLLGRLEIGPVIVGGALAGASLRAQLRRLRKGSE